jgi:hypothetical protein
MTSSPFQKAVKTKAKIRLAIDGPSGSGKTYTALIAATSLADGGKIAVIDTERGSAALYSDKFNFDTATLDTFSPQSYIELIRFAEQAGYSVIVIDSLSHAWEGEGGVLDMHDQATKRQKTQNSYTAWADVTPQHRALIDAILQSKCHVIATMRSKMEYVQEKNSDGRTVIRKVGMAPIQRQGMEYEFTIVGDMDLDHNFAVSKSRMDKIADMVVAKPGAAFFDGIAGWIGSGADAPVPPAKVSRPEPEPQPAPQPATTKPATTQAPKPVWSGVTPEPAGQFKAASVKTSRFQAVAAIFAGTFPEYQDKKGNPDMWHITGAVAKCGFAEITDANLDQVKDAIYARALEAHASDHETTDQDTGN